MSFRRSFCLFFTICFSLITLSSFAAKDEPPKTTLVFSQVFENIVDNSWSNLEFPKDEQPPGLYYIELSELNGMVGCWGSKKNPYEDGPDGELLMAWKDSEPWDNNPDSDFKLQYRPTNAAWMELIAIPAQGAINDTWNPFGLQEAQETIGQTFIAPEEFTGVGLSTPTWNTANSGCTISLYSAEGEKKAVKPGGKLAVKWSNIRRSIY